MATHSEPKGPHTMEELMHPGRHHHSQASGGPACPDPSAHKDSKLQQQASTAALYATSPAKDSNEGILDKDNKLSSRGAAMSLKHAQAEDLPSFPVVGINVESSHGAALLANKHQKPFEHWKPDPSMSASAAAMAAKDYKMAPLWQPELSAAGSKAALLAARDGGKLNLWMPEATAEGNSAAAQAMRKKGLSPEIDYGYTPDGKNKALLAATGALGRSRSGSTPVKSVANYPDAANSAHNALNAATVAGRQSSTRQTPSDRLGSDAMEAARIRHLGGAMPREMFTEHPPVQIEVEEKKHNAALRASAVSMAKQMYDVQKRAEQNVQSSSQGMGATAAIQSSNRASTSATPDVKQQAMQYIHLQEAAHRLAEERLAKLDPDATVRYREHYGYSLNQPRKGISLRGRQRRRANSESQKDEDSSDDEFKSRRIRSQMTKLNKDVQSVDDKKRQQDRANLLAAAEKKVHAQMHNMDEKVFAETGKVSPAMMEEWEAKARAKAQKDSEARTQNFGKTHIGGGKYMDQSEIEAIAAARLKPTLDNINETAAKRRAHDEELRLEAEQRKREEVREQMNRQGDKEEMKRVLNEEKITAKQERAEQKAAARETKYAEKERKAEEKAAAKQEKEVEKARKAEEKRKSKEPRKSTEVGIVAGTGAAGVVAAEEEEPKDVEVAILPPESEAAPSTPPAQASDGSASPAHVDIIAPAPLTQHESPITTVSPTGERVLRPEIERHVTNVETSDSSSDEAETQTRPSALSSVPINPTGTDRSDGHTNEVSTTDAAEEKDIVTEPITGLPMDLNKGTGEGGTDAQPQIHGFVAENTVHNEERPQTPKTAGVLKKKDTKSPSSEPRGLGRFFKGLRRKSQAVESDSPAEKSASGRAAIGTTAMSSTTTSNPMAATTTPGGGLTGSSGLDRAGAASPSSFQRGKAARSISPMSSTRLSSDDEADGVEATRTRLGIGNPAGAGLGSSPKTDGRSSPDNDEEEFEEARDTFDESLAPPPSFAGQAKSSSPVRETHFKEEL